MNLHEQMKSWLEKHPEATVEEAFLGGWLACTDAWCHGRREKFEMIVQQMKEIIE